MSLPLLRIVFPRQVTAIHQIEITSRCNLRCVYCPSHALARSKQDMSMEDFECALSWVRYFTQNGSQRELNLAGIGESTLHPRFPEMVVKAREAVGDRVALVLATNGLIATRELAELFAANRVAVWVSLHRPEKAALAVDLYRQYGVLSGASADPAINANDWAGQVAWHNTARVETFPCPWMRDGRVMVMADGRVTACCLDASGHGVLGYIQDPIPVDMFRTHPYSLCASCYQEIGVHGYDQRRKGSP